jgi:hypothetical protein
VTSTIFSRTAEPDSGGALQRARLPSKKVKFLESIELNLRCCSLDTIGQLKPHDRFFHRSFPTTPRDGHFSGVNRSVFVHHLHDELQGRAAAAG